MVAGAALRPCRLHDVRHAYATAALRAGVPVKVLSERIGHGDVKVTMSIYQHVTPGRRRGRRPPLDEPVPAQGNSPVTNPQPAASL